LQLPRWQQDEILIEGLTRRVQLLESEMNAKEMHHLKELSSVQTKLDSARRENTTLLEHLERAKSHLQQQCDQQLTTRTALHVVTVHRDRLESEKAAFRSELIETRRARDGYLADRNALMKALSNVRSTREALLTAYAEVEGRLATDCSQLKAVIERTITEIDALHAEVSRKRQLSGFNESSADVFCDDMTGRFRSVLESVFSFRDGQTKRHGAASEALGELSLEREHFASDVQAGVRKLVNATVDILTGLSESVATAEMQAQSRSLRQREDMRSSTDHHLALLAQMRDVVERGVGAAKTQYAQLDDALRVWSTKISTRYDSLQANMQTFTGRLVDDLNSLNTYVNEASASQVARLLEHERAIEAFKVGEQANINGAAQRMIQEITSHVSRVLSDNATDTIRRVERSAAALRDETQGIAGDIKEASKSTTSQSSLLASTASGQLENISQELVEAKKQSSAAHETAAAVVASGINASKQFEQDLVDRSTGLSSKLQLLSKEFAEASLDGDRCVQKHAASVKETVAAGSAASISASDNMCAAASDATAALGGMVSEFQEGLDDRLHHVQDFSDSAIADIKDQEATVNVFIHSTIKRDTQPDPKPIKYTFPTVFPLMKPYQEVISVANSDLLPSWLVEEKIRSGKLLQGQGCDFPGERGPQDVSGIAAPSEVAADVSDIVLRLRDSSGNLVKPDLASLPTSALKASAQAIVEDVEYAAKAVGADLEVWFRAMAALVAENSAQAPTDASHQASASSSPGGAVGRFKMRSGSNRRGFLYSEADHVLPSDSVHMDAETA
jgi:hypothetical protein